MTEDGALEASVSDWIDRYQKAWRTNDPEDIGNLFTDEARYFTLPTQKPWEGRDAIIRGWTAYSSPPNYHNLWEIRLDKDGRATEFVEWWIEDDRAEASGE